jgi:predicted SAM-dependent methyltransferase
METTSKSARVASPPRWKVLAAKPFRVLRRLLTGKPLRSGPGPSGTSWCRGRLAPFCQGYGLDLGFGGDPITAHAIRMDMPTPYTHVGEFPVQLGGDASNLYWFRDGVLDFVYSSHLLEDFPDTKAVLREWIRVLKPRGRLILFCPDEQRYRDYCQRTGAVYNTHHQHEHFSLAVVLDALRSLGQDRVLHSDPASHDYSWELVIEKQ